MNADSTYAYLRRQGGHCDGNPTEPRLLLVDLHLGARNPCENNNIQAKRDAEVKLVRLLVITYL